MRAIERMTAERRLSAAIALRMSQSEEKAWKGYIKKLERGSNGSDRP
jgi:hypothetical protein